MTPRDRDRKRLRSLAKESEEKIGKSALFLSLLTKNYSDDPACVLQLGLAILMDKPICLIVEQGQPVSPALQRAAHHIAFCDLNDTAALQKATEESCNAASAYLRSKETR